MLPPKCERLFLRPKRNCSPDDDVWFQKEVIGKNDIGDTVKQYVEMMEKENHPLFSGNQLFTNTSIRKYHEVKLSEAGHHF